ncbi:MAG TPA: amino acid adenylation domain-containing protein [Flavobacterium sp.]|nr:amino acid adenylation domain-containing protein [Flavobacterium sp.]
MFDKYILAPILQNIEQNADRNAFCIDGVFYTYRQFGELVSAIRNTITVQPSSSGITALVANDDLETYASIAALWLEGKAYVPLHPQQPITRNVDIVEQAGVDYILNSSSADFGTKTISTRNLSFSGLHLFPQTTDEQSLAYILFTSGSTGKPKGVPITRGNLGTFMNAFWQTGIAVDETDRCLQAYELTFDLSVQSYLVPLTKGACAFTVPHHEIKYSYVFGLLDDHQLTVAPVPPSLIRFLKPYFDEIDVPSLRYTLLGAEASAIDLIAEWSQCVTNSEIYNCYGPTEATIYCTIYKFPTDGKAKNHNGQMAIGKPFTGITAVIVGDNNEIMPIGNQGELCIAGDQLTAGYWNNPEKNAQSFFEMPFAGQQTRFYRTGDFCHIDEEGDILYHGRMDYQIKIQGYRVELGEIEHHAREFLKQHNTVAVAFENKSGNTEIALYIEGECNLTDELSVYLKTKVPAYMMPHKYIVKDVFPLNTSDKVDRKTLKEMAVS